IATEVMGASFRNIGQIQALAGCDLLTISPELLEELSACTDTLQRQLSPDTARAQAPALQSVNEVAFRTQLNEDAMATEKLAEGIRTFTNDALKLDALIEQARQNQMVGAN